MQSELIKTVVRAIVPRTARNWLRSPSKSAEWLWDSARFLLGSTEELQLAPDWSAVCHPYAYKVARQAQVADPDQAKEFRRFLSCCNNEMLLFDIGASFGIFSLAAAHYGGRAIAVDPSPTAARMIAIQAGLNGCTNSIQIVRAAVSEANGVMDLLSSGVFTHGYFKVAKGRLKRELTQTQAVTIDELVRHFGVPTHVKIDVEGHEAAVLRGARAALRQFSPLLFLELHTEMILSESGDPNSALDELSELGYSTFALSGEAIEKNAILELPIVRIVARREPVTVHVSMSRP
ncbi:MAG: FkbM family methyltransferase [Acidobacteriia bacterium]|nr:FkbM family methyltransferase [Terriglobia bacterium]